MSTSRPFWSGSRCLQAASKSLEEDWSHILYREALGIDRSIDILHHIRELPTPEDRATAVAKVQAVERRAMIDQQPQPGLLRLMNYLQSRGMRRALCTRNFEYVFILITLPLIHLYRQRSDSDPNLEPQYTI